MDISSLSAGDSGIQGYGQHNHIMQKRASRLRLWGTLGTMRARYAAIPSADASWAQGCNKQTLTKWITWPGEFMSFLRRAYGWMRGVFMSRQECHGAHNASELVWRRSYQMPSCSECLFSNDGQRLCHAVARLQRNTTQRLKETQCRLLLAHCHGSFLQLNLETRICHTSGIEVTWQHGPQTSDSIAPQD